MNGQQLLGAVASASLRRRIEQVAPEDGTARFVLDRLTGAQAASIVRALLESADTEEKFRIFMPRALVAGEDLPESVITDDSTVHHRHAPCDRPALLLANTADDQGDSLGMIALVGAKQLADESELWATIAAQNIGLPEDQVPVWIAALQGLTEAADCSLHQFAEFVALTRSAVVNDGRPLTMALGWALPSLNLPRDSAYFASIRPKDLSKRTRWRTAFTKLVTERGPLLRKVRPNRQVIENEELRSHFATVRDEIRPPAHDTIERFVTADPSWTDASAALAQFEWEADGILNLFSGIRTKKLSLAEETLHYLDAHLPDQIEETTRDYLQRLMETGAREPRDDDREFYEEYRDVISREKSLWSKWERFIFGRPIECTDFYEGLLRSIERLHAQAGPLGSERLLEIRAARKSKAQWLDLNADVGTSFAIRYRGLQHLMGPRVQWQVSHLFEYDALLHEAEQKARASKGRSKFRRNESVSRASLQIKFDIILRTGVPNDPDRSVQLIWSGRPDEIGLELASDLERLEQRPLVLTQVARQPVSRKGALQSVSLDDVSTLQPAFGQDSGSLVPRTTMSGTRDLKKIVPTAIKEAATAGRLSAAAAKTIGVAWTAFADTYSRAVADWRTQGLAAEAVLEQANRYFELLNSLLENAAGDISRRDLLEPIISLGCVPVTGGPPTTIVAPWHPLRMVSRSIKARSLAGLFQHVLTAETVNFGDSRLFFADLRAELLHPYYPEIAVGYQGPEPVLLVETSSVNDYSLMERTVREPTQSTTDVDPAEASRQIRGLLERYLELQPHERANLSIMLYNCDAAGLPLATINALGSVHDEEEMHCNVLVRHQDRRKLGQVYQELLEKSEGDPDALVVSETSRNFMSKLRIGVMLDSPANSRDEKGVDVAFLHDVVSRQAKETWISVPDSSTAPDLLEHVPPRWSYRRVTAEDELKSTSFLICPRQPKLGWAYIDAVGSVVRRQASVADEHWLPARQISFQDQGLKGMFDEVHRLAEWVATYDDLLDKRQLAAQGISVIRYRRQRTHGRNMVVSSTAELRILHVLVRRRLLELNLGLSEDELADLTRKLIADAGKISGDIVLRAAKRGVSAGELIGLVLSQALMADELGRSASIAWFLLDDYAEWLGQREQGIADILALSVSKDAAGNPSLSVVVSEAKYVEGANAAAARRSSRQQLRQTVQRMEDALFGDPGRLDRDLWLSRIADLLLDGAAAVGETATLDSVRDNIRNGTVPIDLRGYSHIFVYGPEGEGPTQGEQEPIAEVHRGIQEVFDRDRVRRLLKAYLKGEPLKAVRAELGDERPWEGLEYRSPAPRVSWTSRRQPPDAAESLGDSGPGDPPDTSGGTGPGGTGTPPPNVPLTPTGPSNPPASPASAAAKPSGLQTLIAARCSAAASSGEEDEQWLTMTAQKLRTALLGYGLQAKVTGTRLTPNAALIRFAGSDRLGLSDIEAKRTSLLTTHALRVISISPLPGEIVVAVARPKRQTVSLWDVWSCRQTNRTASGVNMAFVVGLKELDGELLYLNLGPSFSGSPQHDPHTLIAGATGSGKSVLIQGLLLDIAATNSPRLAKIYLVDPKMGADYSAIGTLPHVEGGIVTTQERAKEIMTLLVTEMDRRYTLFSEKRLPNLSRYNAVVDEADRLPTIFLVHDEFAEWMLTEDYADAVSTLVQRLGVKARAAGIHLIFAAQRPDANVMPVQLRDNLGNRLILKVASVGTSEIALGGIKGAELLLGNGHLAARLSGEESIIYAQCAFLNDEQIIEVVEAIRADWSATEK